MPSNLPCSTFIYRALGIFKHITYLTAHSRQFCVNLNELRKYQDSWSAITSGNVFESISGGKHLNNRWHKKWLTPTRVQWLHNGRMFSFLSFLELEPQYSLALWHGSSWFLGLWIPETPIFPITFSVLRNIPLPSWSLGFGLNYTASFQGSLAQDDK